MLILCYFWRWVCKKTLLWWNKLMHRQKQAILNQSDSKDIWIRKIIFAQFTSKEISYQRKPRITFQKIEVVFIRSTWYKPIQWRIIYRISIIHASIYMEKKKIMDNGKLRKGYFMSGEKKISAICIKALFMPRHIIVQVHAFYFTEYNW